MLHVLQSNFLIDHCSNICEEEVKVMTMNILKGNSALLYRHEMVFSRLYQPFNHTVTYDMPGTTAELFLHFLQFS
jgi:hypothetical protein